MKFKFKKVLSLITIIAIIMFVAVTPMLHTHACHDTNCLVDNFHSCHDADCVIYSLFNKYQDLIALVFLTFMFLSLVNIKDDLLILKTDFKGFLYNNLVKQKVKLTD